MAFQLAFTVPSLMHPNIVRGPPKAGRSGLANKAFVTVSRDTITGTLTYWAVTPANEASSNFKLLAFCDFG